MSKKKDSGGDEKLPPDEDMKHENLNLATEREEIFKRMQVLLGESKEIKTKYSRLLDEHDDQLKEYSELRQESIRKQNKHKEKKLMLEKQREELNQARVQDNAEWQQRYDNLER